MDAPAVAAWIHDNLELAIGKGCKTSPAKWIEVVGWKGHKDNDELKVLDGCSFYLGAECRPLEGHLQRRRNIPPE